MVQMKKCPKCQKPNAPQNIFCEYCGTRLQGESTQPPRPQPIPPHESTCPHCGAVNPKGANNCVSCGKKLTQATSQQTMHSSSPKLFATRIDKLGNRLDGWADLVDGAADKVDAVRAAFIADIEERAIPRVDGSSQTLTPGGLAGKRRDYYLAQSYPGATLAVFVGDFGQDLYVAWDLFVRPHIKWRNILLILGIAAALAIFPASDSYSAFRTWLLATVGGFIITGIIALILGKVLRGNAWAFFLEEIDHFAADDVTATMFAVHHALLKAIDTTGLDSSLLRSKKTFKAGRRERIM